MLQALWEFLWSPAKLLLPVQHSELEVGARKVASLAITSLYATCLRGNWTLTASALEMHQTSFFPQVHTAPGHGQDVGILVLSGNHGFCIFSVWWQDYIVGQKYGLEVRSWRFAVDVFGWWLLERKRSFLVAWQIWLCCLGEGLLPDCLQADASLHTFWHFITLLYLVYLASGQWDSRNIVESGMNLRSHVWLCLVFFRRLLHLWIMLETLLQRLVGLSAVAVTPKAFFHSTPEPLFLSNLRPWELGRCERAQGGT